MVPMVRESLEILHSKVRENLEGQGKSVNLKLPGCKLTNIQKKFWSVVRRCKCHVFIGPPSMYLVKQY